jgi:pilus assembly protein CpaB
MNVTRIAILCVAAIAAGAAALLVRGLLGGGTPAVEASAPPPPAIMTTDILVASKDIPPGRALDKDSVRWDTWPSSSVSSTFFTKNAQPDIAKAVDGITVRSPLVRGQPITDASIVRAGATGFMAATIKPGMRAISMPVSAETGAGGFILPNDRVDVILTRDTSTGGQVKFFQSVVIVRDVRVLGIDQTFLPTKDQQSVVGKTATLELTPAQSALISRAHAEGTLSLALRALGDSTDQTYASYGGPERVNVVNVIRYGVQRKTDSAATGRPPQ